MSVNVLTALSAHLPQEGIQRTKGTETKKGYDTTGYGYQYCVDRFNEVCGEAWGYSYRIIHESTGTYKSGQLYYDITADVAIWVNDRNNPRSCVGGHKSADYADAVKGAITNGFKKTAAFWGVGADAYRGTIDDDNLPGEDIDYSKPQDTRTENQKEFDRLTAQLSKEGDAEWTAKLKAEKTPEGKTRVLTALREFVKSIDRTPKDTLADDPGLNAVFDGKEKPAEEIDLF